MNSTCEWSFPSILPILHASLPGFIVCLVVDNFLKIIKVVINWSHLMNRSAENDREIVCTALKVRKLRCDSVRVRMVTLTQI